MSSSIQAIIFQKKYYTTKKARTFLKKNKFTPIKRVHKTNEYLRYRLQNPSKFKRFITKSILKGKVKLIIGFNK